MVYANHQPLQELPTHTSLCLCTVNLHITHFYTNISKQNLCTWNFGNTLPKQQNKVHKIPVKDLFVLIYKKAVHNISIKWKRGWLIFWSKSWYRNAPEKMYCTCRMNYGCNYSLVSSWSCASLPGSCCSGGAAALQFTAEEEGVVRLALSGPETLEDQGGASLPHKGWRGLHSSFYRVWGQAGRGK